MNALSLCMIVRNEERYIKECLESVKEVAPEIILIDTGSIDKTVDIANEYGLKVHHFVWINDFSAARNYALSKATGKWILYLDADERLNPSSIKELKKIISTDEKIGYRCEVLSKNSKNDSSQIMWYTRLFYNSPGIQFSGSIHEQIDPSLKEFNYNFKTSNIRIDHLGYDISAEDIKKKGKRNLGYLLNDFSRQPSSYIAYQIGNTYQILEDGKNAFIYFCKAIEDDRLNNEYKAVCYLQMADFMLSEHNLKKAKEYIDAGVKENPGLPHLYFISSRVNSRLGYNKEAIIACKQAIRCNENIIKGVNRFSNISTTLNIRKPLYQGIYLSVLNSDSESLKVFLKELSGQNSTEALIIQKLLTNSIISENERKLLTTNITEYNLDCYILLLKHYNYKTISLSIAESLLDHFSVNSRLLKYLGEYYLENNNFLKAIMYFEKALEVPEKDPSAAFLLISVLVQMNEIEKLKNVLSKTETVFRNIPEVLERIIILKAKLNPLFPSLK